MNKLKARQKLSILWDMYWIVYELENIYWKQDYESLKKKVLEMFDKAIEWRVDDENEWLDDED